MSGHSAGEVAEERLRDLVSRLGFGDGRTEPMADNDTIVAWFEDRTCEAGEWRESQRWRDECALAGHPDDEDCLEHDPILRAEARGAEKVRARVETLAAEWEEWARNRSTVRIDAFRDAAEALRTALAGGDA